MVIQICTAFVLGNQMTYLRLPPKNGFTGSPQELITEGGELEFCRKLIRESKEYRNNVLIFTTMIGHKYNLNILIHYLKLEGIKYTHTEFCQGRVTRWGLAWTYQDYDLYNLVPAREKTRKKHSPTMFLLPELPNCSYNSDEALNKIKDILNILSISHKVLDKRGCNVSIDIIANTNTWSNQRRKRRLMQKQILEVKRPKLIPSADGNIDNSVITTKYIQCSDTGENRSDVPKSSNNKDSLSTPNNLDIDENNDGESFAGSVHSFKDQPLVHAFLKLLKKDNDIVLEIEFLDGSAGKEGLHQIVQYIKNNWK